MPVRTEATNLVAKSYVFMHRARLRVHFGTHLECTYAFLSSGLPTSFLPFTDESELKTDNHKKWIKRRIVKEQGIARGVIFSCIELPHRNDILSGKGKPFRNHPGSPVVDKSLHKGSPFIPFLFARKLDLTLPTRSPSSLQHFESLLSWNSRTCLVHFLQCFADLLWLVVVWWGGEGLDDEVMTETRMTPRPPTVPWLFASVW
jgi:hypothetical protein